MEDVVTDVRTRRGATAALVRWDIGWRTSWTHASASVSLTGHSQEYGAMDSRISGVQALCHFKVHSHRVKMVTKAKYFFDVLLSIILYLGVNGVLPVQMVFQIGCRTRS